MTRPAPINLLLVHGAGGGGWEWAIWQSVFQAHRVYSVAPDLQPSCAGIAATTLDDYLAQVRAAIDALPPPRALIGASLGGLLAAACADAADALVLVNPLPPAPWSGALPDRARADVVPWGRDARLASTRRALPDADDATAIAAFRRWRDESGRALAQARRLEVPAPRGPVLCIASSDDADVPAATTAALAVAWNGELMRVPGSHVGPLLGRNAAEVATRVIAWLSSR